MDFFERQDRARQRTKLLVLFFAMAVALIVLAVYGVALLLLAGIRLRSREEGIADGWEWVTTHWWDPQLFLGALLGTVTVIGVAAALKMLQIRHSGGAVAEMLGGRPVQMQSEDPDEQRLINVVEEMSIASGVPVPELYVLDGEPGINAFAAGNSPNDAAIGVTQGTLRILNRDELQGVIAHEFSHILNGDMRLNLRLIGILSGILGLAILGRVLLYSGAHGGRTRGQGGAVILVLGLALMLIGAIGVFFGRLIKSAVSRQREFLADAAAVQWTRNPNGLSGALKKIGGLASGSRLSASNAEEASHLFFGNGLKPSWWRGFSTHPPLTERIRAIDPSFDGVFPEVQPAERGSAARTASLTDPASVSTAAPGLANGLAQGQGPGPSESVPIEVDAESILPSVGNPSASDLEYAGKILAELPAHLRDAIHEPFGASAVAYCLLLSPDEKTRTAQWAILQEHAHPGTFQELQRLREAVRGLGKEWKLLLIDLGLPALRQLSHSQYTTFRRNIRLLIEHDRQIDLFEPCLERILRRHLDPRFTPQKRRVIHYYGLKGLLKDCEVILSALVHLGHHDPRAREKAFATAARQLGDSGSTLTLLNFNECNLSQIEGALDRLSLAAPKIRRRVLAALAQGAASDRVICKAEAELLRAVADQLESPLPPLIRQSNSPKNTAPPPSHGGTDTPS